MGVRPEWDEYFIQIAEAVGLRGDCCRRQIGCILVNAEKHIVATGYNGVRSGEPGCLSGACPRGRLTHDELPPDSNYDTGPGKCIASHAETNALLHLSGLPQGLTAYVSAKPCPACERTLYNAGLVKVVWPEGEYQWHSTKKTS